MKKKMVPWCTAVNTMQVLVQYRNWLDRFSRYIRESSIRSRNAETSFLVSVWRHLPSVAFCWVYLPNGKQWVDGFSVVQGSRASQPTRQHAFWPPKQTRIRRQPWQDRHLEPTQWHCRQSREAEWLFKLELWWTCFSPSYVTVFKNYTSPMWSSSIGRWLMCCSMLCFPMRKKRSKTAILSLNNPYCSIETISGWHSHIIPAPTCLRQEKWEGGYEGWWCGRTISFFRFYIWH